MAISMAEKLVDTRKQTEEADRPLRSAQLIRPLRKLPQQIMRWVRRRERAGNRQPFSIIICRCCWSSSIGRNDP